ncbi:MAG: DUF3386 domain-containing protein [Synechococcaceae cyanobacterium]|nr:DUF3386 domain-containing protein [Synechococcaceae cyanobacterium]
MTSTSPAAPASLAAPGSDCTALFRAAYENRYTWDPGFPGYQGRCLWERDGRLLEGRFQVGADLKAAVEGIDDEAVHKELAGQLWEVAIHRVRRSFEQTHGENTFSAGDTDPVGLEVIVGGKGAGDRYRIKDNIVTMVHRHIHGTVVTIFTTSVTDTGAGYLSRTYTSRYSDPASGAPRGGENAFTDTFVPLIEGGPWVLAERQVRSEAEAGSALTTYRFEDLRPLA